MFVAGLEAVIIDGQQKVVNKSGEVLATWSTTVGSWVDSAGNAIGNTYTDMKEWANNYYINATFPENPDEFNPDGLVKKEWDTPNGKVVKWLNPDTGKSEYEWNEDLKHGAHYHKTPDGNNREEHPDTGNAHMYPGDSVPE